MLVLVDFLQATVRPSHWDTLLAVQQKFGRDFNDLMQLVQQTSTKRAQAISTEQEQPLPFQDPPSAPSSLIYRVHFKMRGFRIGLDGAASTLFLECQDIGGQLQNVHGQNWDISLSDLALSLAPRTAPHGMGSSFNRALRSAFVIIDFKVKGEKGAGETQNERARGNNRERENWDRRTRRRGCGAASPGGGYAVHFAQVFARRARHFSNARIHPFL